ncbi:MAG: T9SS type A sorting domain-containing protein, partial [Bacteroidetes bacterium]|nr:T9SS type A sorting domain-containing protein [Bacteroidota bacterium]
LSVTVTLLPGPATVTGNTNVCQNSIQSYSASASNATSYNWTVPSGWAINSGQGSSTISVTVGSTSGNVTATPSNSCGSGTPGSLSATVILLPGPAVITGNTIVFEGSTEIYNATSLNATSFFWTTPPGWSINSGQNTSSITVTVGDDSGIILVVPQNICGNGQQGQLEIDVITGLEINDNNPKILCYPNPFEDRLYIKSEIVFAHIQIFSAIGKKVIDCKYSDVLNLSQLVSGFYYIRILNNSGDVVFQDKIIKK